MSRPGGYVYPVGRYWEEFYELFPPLPNFTVEPS
jgi:hypothetical protein